MLALLAAAGERGWSRDQLLLFFWPDTSQTRAKHSLDQLLYALRSSLGDSLFSGTNPVRLSRAVVSSDVDEFSAAIDRGDLTTAVNLYRGPFLDGFHLDAAPEFDQWIAAERLRLERMYVTALEQLALAAEAAQDQGAAVRWWRRIVEVDPLSNRNAAGLIRALMNAGDHAAALQFAEQFESLVARELDTSVGPTVASLVAEVRADAETESVIATKRPSPPGAPPPSLELGAPGRERVRTGWSALALGGMAAAVVLAAAVFWPSASAGRGVERDAPPSIAVLPLVQVGAEPNADAIADGISDELITSLSRLGALRVVARQSSFAFKGQTLDPRTIADSLGVTHLLEGSYQRVGDRLRIHVRLVDAQQRMTRWSQAYERRFDDILEVQSEIAAAVAGELEVQLGNRSRVLKPLTRSIPAYELYLKGRDPVHLRSHSGPATGLALLQQAVALDSLFAAAWAAMPTYYFRLAETADTLLARQYQELAFAAARRAITIDPALPNGHAALGVATNITFSNLRESEALFRQALALGGAPRVREHLSRTLMWSGRFAEALRETRLAMEEDPFSAAAAANYGEALCVNGRTDEGVAQLDRLEGLPTPLLRLRSYRGICLAMQGKWAEAVLKFENPTGAGLHAPLTGYAVARSGDTVRALRLFNEAAERWRRSGRGATHAAFIAAGLRDFDLAFEWLDRSARDQSLTGAVVYPFFSDLHSDPRFVRYRQRVGLQNR